MASPKPIPAADLATAVANTHGTTVAEAKRMLASVQKAVHDLVAKGETVRLPDLATFSSADVPERQIRNPATGELQTAAATRRVKIIATGPLKAAVKSGADT